MYPVAKQISVACCAVFEVQHKFIHIHVSARLQNRQVSSSVDSFLKIIRFLDYRSVNLETCGASHNTTPIETAA
jgi:hypothetical protein